MIYMDNAATTLQKPEEVKQAILYALEHMGNAGRGGTEAALGCFEKYLCSKGKACGFLSMQRSPSKNRIYCEFYRESEYCIERFISTGRSCDHNSAGT